MLLPETELSRERSVAALPPIARAAGAWRRTAWGLAVSMRPYQWTKNVFALAPLLFGGKLGDAAASLAALSATASFCLAASGLYLINDVCDVRADRANPKKRSRPIASGEVSHAAALAIATMLLGFAVTLAVAVSGPFTVVLGGYILWTLAYCLFWKHAVVLDCMAIAGGFVLRVLGGSVAAGVQPSTWLIACTFLLALYLALAKRRQELAALESTAVKHRSVFAGYTIAFLDQAITVVVGATIVCYALYTVAPETVAHFATTRLQYGTVFVIYGLLRYMALIHTKNQGDNPSAVVYRDRPLALAIFGWAAYNLLVIYGPELAMFGRRLLP